MLILGRPPLGARAIRRLPTKASQLEFQIEPIEIVKIATGPIHGEPVPLGIILEPLHPPINNS